VGGIGNGGAVLVRPDNHVAYRSTGPVADAATELGGALEAVLAR
jgi:2,4-dichlorophenol 6-monooxygenase